MLVEQAGPRACGHPNHKVRALLSAAELTSGLQLTAWVRSSTTVDGLTLALLTRNSKCPRIFAGARRSVAGAAAGMICCRPLLPSRRRATVEEHSTVMLLQTLAVKMRSLGMCLSSYRHLLPRSSAISAAGTAGGLRGASAMSGPIFTVRGTGRHLNADFRIVAERTPYHSACWACR